MQIEIKFKVGNKYKGVDTWTLSVYQLFDSENGIDPESAMLHATMQRIETKFAPDKVFYKSIILSGNYREVELPEDK